MTDSPTLSPIVINNQLCDFDSLLLQLNDTFYQIGDTQWIDDCLQLLDTRTHQLSIVCGCVGKFQHSMANQYLNCVLEQPWHGLTVWNMCQSSIYSQSCGSQCTGWLISEEPTANPTISQVETDPPTPGPTMTDSPTLSPIVINNQLCDFDSLLLQLNDTFYQIGDTQWIDDCLQLLDTRTHQLSIVCGCVGKFQHSMANQYLNCVLEQPWHGLTVWNTCQSSIYSQSCGSQCTGWLRRRQSQQEISHNRRRAVANSTFKLIWSEAVCQIEPTFEPSSLPTSSPTDDPAYDPTNEPTDYPSTSPTDDPTNEPTDSPTNNPTDFPTAEPTDFPTAYPTSNPTVAPTSEPTDAPTCIKYETWTNITANDICPNGSWGNTDKGYGSMVACDSNLQAKLEESAANRLFHLCSSYCIYDYHSLLAQQQAAYIWKSSQQCYLAVDRWTCFSGHAYQIFVGLQDYAAAICQNSTSS